MASFFLGLDIGATKSQALVANEEGQALGYGLAGPGNHEVVGFLQVFFAPVCRIRIDRKRPRRSECPPALREVLDTLRYGLRVLPTGEKQHRYVTPTLQVLASKPVRVVIYERDRPLGMQFCERYPNTSAGRMSPEDERYICQLLTPRLLREIPQQHEKCIGYAYSINLIHLLVAM